MTTTTTSCPSWCTKDHAEQSATAWELYREGVRTGLIDDTQAERDTMELAIIERGMTHTAHFGGDARCVVVQVDPGESGIDEPMIYDDQFEALTAEEAREYGRALLAAADLLDRIEATQ